MPVLGQERLPANTQPFAQSSKSATRIDDDFIAEHLQRIFLQIHRRVRNVDDAQELTQEVFIRALRNHHQLQDRQKTRQWISRIAINAAIDFLRQRRDTVVFSDTTTDAPLADYTEDNPEQIATRTQDHRMLHRALVTLGERERTALVLRDIDELPAREVAQLMGCSQATVRSHIANARIKLKHVLGRGQDPPA